MKKISTLADLAYPDTRKIAAWQKAFAIPGYDPAIWRFDRFGNIIHWRDHGKLTEHGWETDHIIPMAKGGPDSPDNLQALHWKANRTKSDHLI